MKLGQLKNIKFISKNLKLCSENICSDRLKNLHNCFPKLPTVRGDGVDSHCTPILVSNGHRYGLFSFWQKNVRQLKSGCNNLVDLLIAQEMKLKPETVASRPGRYATTQKTGNFSGKRVKSPFLDNFSQIEKFP